MGLLLLSYRYGLGLLSYRIGTIRGKYRDIALFIAHYRYIGKGELAALGSSLCENTQYASAPFHAAFWLESRHNSAAIRPETQRETTRAQIRD